MNNRNIENLAVSEILGSMLILSITVAIFASIYVGVLSERPEIETPIVTIKGSLIEDFVILTHYGGEPLSLDTKIKINIANSSENITVKNYLEDSYKLDGEWNIGETITYQISNYTGKQVEVIVVDFNSKDIVFQGFVKDTFSDISWYSNISGGPDMIYILSNSFAIVVYSADNDSGIIETIKIESNGDIGEKIDALIFDTKYCEEPNVFQVSNNIFAIAYNGQGNKGTLLTVNIDSKGEISDVVLDTLIFDSNQGLNTDVTHVSGDIFAIAYRGQGYKGTLKTVEIFGNGQISDSVKDSLVFEPLQATETSIVWISENMIAIAYRQSDKEGIVKTAAILSNGEISDTVIDSLEFEGDEGIDPEIIHVTGTIYAIAYEGPDDKGYLTTIDISSVGDINDTIIDTYIFDSDQGKEPDIIQISEEYYAIAYRGKSDLGVLKTVRILPNGNIIDSIVDLLNLQKTCNDPDIINILGDNYVIGFRSLSKEGYLLTVQIEKNGNIY
ncbi:MAG: type IV pilin [Candidatus Thermoplasmatota archaeon]|nr:type IV pilin [Candidatus Thermoplasmatota archaeon]